MAHPVFSFVDPNSGVRYYQILDTVTGYFHTVPMDLLTYLRFKGLHDQEVVQVLYMFYDRLIQHGSTMSWDSFLRLPSRFKQQSFDYVSQRIDPPSSEEIEINRQLEFLLSQNKGYYEVWTAYQEILAYVNPHTKRPRSYYLSWDYTMRQDPFYEELVSSIFRDYQVPTTKKKVRGYWISDLAHWIDEDYFGTYPEAMSQLFYDLVRQGELFPNAIPHILRKNHRIEELYCELDMEKYLPQKSITHELWSDTPFHWQNIELSDVSEFAVDPNPICPYEIVQLNCHVKGGFHELFLFTEYPLDVSELVRRCKECMNVLLRRRVDLTVQVKMDLKLYIELTTHHYYIGFLPASLNIFRVNMQVESVQFIPTYYSHQLVEKHFRKETLLRSNFTHHMLELKHETGTSKTFFKLTTASNTFRENCEVYICREPLRKNEELESFRIRFTSYLLGLGYTELPCYQLSTDLESVKQILGADLNHEGKFDVTYDDDNDPF
jgi:hypothetical protein